MIERHKGIEARYMGWCGRNWCNGRVETLDDAESVQGYAAVVAV